MIAQRSCEGWFPRRNVSVYCFEIRQHRGFETTPRVIACAISLPS
jgi:hypothetical protein